MVKSEILFLKQEDVIKAGLLDMKQVLAACEKTYQLFGKGEIINHPKAVSYTHLDVYKRQARARRPA